MTYFTLDELTRSQTARLLGLDTEKIEPVTMMTLGYPGPADRLAEPFRTRETLPRERKEVKSFVHKLE